MIRLLVLLLSLLALSTHAAFVPFHTTPSQCLARQNALPTPEESAKVLTDYMAKAHEEKIKAMAAVEAKYQDRIQELENQVRQLEERAPVQTGSNTYEMPCTNKQMTKKVEQYRNFIQDYLVKAQIQRVQAVAAAEQKVKAHYQDIISSMKPTRVAQHKEFE